MKPIAIIVFAIHAFLVGFSHAAEKPNILVILADDLGFSDLGCYGSEIETPNLDRLAAGGVRFTQFYNTAKCHSSRVSLLTGRWCQQAGDVSLSRAVTIPEVLAPAGYFTAMTGKWHLSKQPTDFGFQRYFGHLSGACNYYKGDKSFRLNGQPWSVPAEGFYTTVANVDHALKFLGEARTEKKPWFLYLAFNAPHAPLQPLEADYKKYLGRYDVGWDVMRSARIAKQKRLGLFGRDVEASPRPDHIPAWEKLAPETQRWESRRMAAYAALIDRLDQEIGRLLRDVETRGELDNTLVLFFSDNGACPYDRNTTGQNQEPFRPGVSWSDSTGWAWARNSPFRFYKQNQFEGGIATPAIMHWPAGLKQKPGSLVHLPAHLVDVLPTLAEVARAKVPASFPGRELSPLAGVSLAPLLAGREIASRPPIHLLFARDRGLRDGDWKLVSFQSGPWELYNLAADRAELHNVAAQHPDIVRRMAEQWHEMTANVLKAPAGQRAPVAEKADDQVHREWSVYTRGANTSSRDEKTRPRSKAGKAGRKKAAAHSAPAQKQAANTDVDGYSDGRPVAALRMDARDEGRILRHGDGPDQCDINGIREASIVAHEGVYHLYYDGCGPGSWLACLATSTDLKTWTKHGVKLSLGAPGTDDGGTATSPWFIREDGMWHMFYVGCKQATPAPHHIPMAPYFTLKARSESLSGPWTKQPDVIPFRPQKGTYNFMTASPGFIVRKEDQFMMFYSAGGDGPPFKRSLGIARTKNLDGPWQVAPSPIVPLDEQIENSSLYYEPANQTWFLFTNHVGIDKEGREFTDAIWVYWSRDLDKWDAANKAVVLDGKNCSWSSRCIGMPTVVKMKDRLALLYDAPGGDSISHMNRDIGLAWLDLPLQPPSQTAEKEPAR